MADACGCASRLTKLSSVRRQFHLRELILTKPEAIIRCDFVARQSTLGSATCEEASSKSIPVKAKLCHGFTLAELLIALAVGSVLAAMAIPIMSTAMTGMRLSSTVAAISGAISNTRYRAIKDSQVYTLTITTPGNTYAVTNVGTGVADAPVPLPNPGTLLNGGASATYTFTLCPNGTVYGAGAACPGNNTPPTLAATYRGRETDLSVSSAGNVTTKNIH